MFTIFQLIFKEELLLTLQNLCKYIYLILLILSYHKEIKFILLVLILHILSSCECLLSRRLLKNVLISSTLVAPAVRSILLPERFEHSLFMEFSIRCFSAAFCFRLQTFSAFRDPMNR